jgi:diacylglycerol kinase family enzyme
MGISASTVPVIVGGDGTVLALMPILLRRALPFALLPMGTMNLLARDLGLVGDLNVDVQALHTGRTRRVDLATLNGVPFHSASGLGFAVIVARERERARLRIPFSLVLATAVAAVRALFRTRPIEVEVEVDGHVARRVADAVLVTNNVFEGSPWRRPRLDEGVLEVHLLVAPGFWARSRAALAVMTGEWRALRHLTSFKAPAVTLRQPGRRRIRVTLDGEVTLQDSVLSYAVVPRALEVLAADPEVTVRRGRIMSNERALGI